MTVHRIKKQSVSWNETQMKAIDTTKAGSYEIEGALEEGTTVTAHGSGNGKLCGQSRF